MMIQNIGENGLLFYMEENILVDNNVKGWRYLLNDQVFAIRCIFLMYSYHINSCRVVGQLNSM